MPGKPVLLFCCICMGPDGCRFAIPGGGRLTVVGGGWLKPCCEGA